MATTIPRIEVESIPCNVCGVDQAEELYAANIDSPTDRDGWMSCTDDRLGQHGRIVRCRACGLVYTNPRYRCDAIVDAYEAVQDPTYVAESQARIKTFAKSLDLIERYHPQRGRLLDVGCYTGVFLQVARSRGWKVQGLEPSQWACALAQAQGMTVHQGTLTTAPWSAPCFDVITLWDVLEHLTDPLGDLQRVHALLVPNGHVALTTINIGSLPARLLGTRWWWLMEMHLYYFSRGTLTRMLEKAGFQVVGIHQHVRMISVGYLWTRLEPYLRGGARALAWCGERLRLNQWHIPVTLGDLITVIAKKR